jgi:hypothetical protein
VAKSYGGPTAMAQAVAMKASGENAN